MAFELKSTAFKHGGMIPRIYTCDGKNHSPPLAWSQPPSGTKSFLLVCEDPDAPAGMFHHWAIWNISASMHRLDENCSAVADRLGLKQAINDFGRHGYGGPCPPQKDRAHRYYFRLYALDVNHLPAGEKASVKDAAHLAERHSLGMAELIGTYKRPLSR